MFNLFKKKDDIIKDPIRPSDARPDVSGPGLMVIEDVFSITGRGTVVTGRIGSGSFRIGDSVRVTRESGEVINTAIIGIEAFRKALDVATAGDNVGLLLRDVERNQIGRGDRIEIA